MRNPDRQKRFRFKQFEMSNDLSAMKIGTDGVLLGAWAFADCVDQSVKSSERLRILDVGAGTGLISIMLAQRFASALITGIEIDDEAAGEAKYNCQISPWPDRLNVIHDDFNHWVESQLPSQFDMIVSNPPFFSPGMNTPENSRMMARQTVSLDAKAILRHASALLKTGGRVAFVLPAEVADGLKLDAVLAELTLLRSTAVSTKPGKPPIRHLVEFVKPAEPAAQLQCNESSLVVGSPEYQQLVKPFLLDKN